MSAPRSWVRPGEWTALSGEGIWVLAQTGDDATLLSQLWQTVSSGPDADAVLTRLMSRGFEHLHGFAIAAIRGDSLRLVARHPARADLLIDGVTQQVMASASITWTDVSQKIPDRLTLSTGAEAANTLEFPLALGATAASSLRIDFTDVQVAEIPEIPHDSTPEPAVAPAAPIAGGTHANRDAVEDAPLQEDAPPQPVEPVEPTEPAEPEVSTSTNPYLNLLTDSTMEREALIERLNNEAAEPDAADGSEASIASPHDEALASNVTAAWTDDIVTGPEPEAAPEPIQPAEPAAPSGLIDGVPGMSLPPLAPPTAFAAEPPVFGTEPPTFGGPALGAFPSFQPEPAGMPDQAGQLDDAPTTNRATLHRLLEETGSSSTSGATVMAVRCGQGHLSSPVLPDCRVCGTPIPEQTPHSTTRPSLGDIVMPNGDTIPLDKNVVLGRAPESIDGGEHLVTVNTTGEISRKHALIALDGWNVLLRDLNTTNGTYLKLPGQDIVQLRANEDYLVEPGSEIDLADVLTLRFQVHG